MTDRHAGYIVTLREDIREDDAEFIITALTMVKGVMSVKPLAGDYQQHIAAERRDGAWEAALRSLASNGPTAAACDKWHGDTITKAAQ